MPAIKEAHEASSWDELKELITFEEVRHILEMRERQRVRDKFRNLKRRAILDYAQEHPEVEEAALKAKK